MVGLLGYKIEYGGKAGASTSINLGLGEQSSSFTYVYGGDLNGDRINGNDLCTYESESDLRFVPISQNLGGSSAVLYTEAQQQAFDKFIDQDAYLSTKRGQYVDTRIFYLCYIEWIYRLHKIFH
jgi:hypothetical protein